MISLVVGSMGRTTHRPSVWCSNFKALVFFFHISYIKTLYFYYCKVVKKIKKKKWNNFCKEVCKKLWKKNNTWNIRRLVHDSFVRSTQWPSVLYWRLTDFCTALESLLPKWVQNRPQLATKNVVVYLPGKKFYNCYVHCIAYLCAGVVFG
jgi:hypothetical protein